MLPLRRTSPSFTPRPPDPIDPPSARRARPRLSFVRRTKTSLPDIRASVQLGFLLLNVWIGWQFYFWVRYYETGGVTVRVPRPPGIEGWLPIASLMNLKYLIVTGDLPAVHPAGLFLIVAFLGMSLAVRKSFCSWLCPIGTLSEWLWQGGEALLGRTFAPPKWIDIPLRSLKYVLMGLFLAAVASMSADALAAFLSSPYGLVADVKMLDFFRLMGTTTAGVILGLVVASIFVKNAWCRYLCPYGALMGLVALLSPTRIRRDPALCIDCAKCAKACPSRLPVDRLLSVRSAECSACLSCVSACPVQAALELRAVRRWTLSPRLVAGVVIGAVVLAVGVARATGHWHTLLPDQLLFDLIPRAHQFGHP